MDSLITRKSKITLIVMGSSKVEQSKEKCSSLVFERTFASPITKVVTFKSRLELEND